MHKKLLFILVLCSCDWLLATGNKIVKTYYQAPSNTSTGIVKEEYEVAENNDTIKNGFYKKYANNSDASLLIEGFYLNNKKEGVWKDYDYNGKLKNQSNYKDDSYFGEQKQFDLDGKTTTVYYTNIDGQLDGNFKIFNAKNSCVASGNYTKNKQEGKWTYYYDNEKIRCVIPYKNDLIIDTSWSYYPSGKKMAFRILQNNRMYSLVGYYENGKKQYTCNVIDTSLYIYHKKYFYENGKLKYESTDNDTVTYTIQYYSRKGIKLDNSTYLNGNGILKTYNDDTLISEISYKNYLKDGLTVFYYPNGTKKRSVNYLQDKMVGIWNNYNADGTLDFIGRPIEEKEDTSKIDYTDIPASFRGGNVELMTFLKKNIRYPSLARENGLEGKVIIRFTVDELGIIRDMKLLRDAVGGGCGDESLRVAKQMTMWNPAYKYGFPVKTYSILPVTFKLM